MKCSSPDLNWTWIITSVLCSACKHSHCDCMVTNDRLTGTWKRECVSLFTLLSLFFNSALIKKKQERLFLTFPAGSYTKNCLVKTPILCLTGSQFLLSNFFCIYLIIYIFIHLFIYPKPQPYNTFSVIECIYYFVNEIYSFANLPQGKEMY